MSRLSLLASMALRNVARKRLRAAATVGAMGLAGAMVIFYAGLMGGMQKTMVAAVIENETGHLQAHAQGFRKDPDLYKTLDLPAGHGLTAAPRLLGFGLAALGEASSGAEIRGLDPHAEAAVSRLHLLVAEGAWLNVSDPAGVVLGRKLAKRLDARPGDTLVVLTQAADGSMADALLRVRGVLKSVGGRTDEAGLFTTEGFFRELYAMPQGWHEVAIRLPGPEPDLALGAERVRAALPSAEVLDWRSLLPMAASMVDSQAAGMLIVTVIAYLAVALVVFNAMLMSVFERIREFGVMRALGSSPGQLFGVICLEALAESLAACAVALGIGLPLSWAMARWGLDLRRLMPESASFGGLTFDPILYSDLGFGDVMQALTALLALSLLAVLYPAWKAAKLDPVAAMRHR